MSESLSVAKLFTLRAQTAPPRMVSDLPSGDRVVIDITGGAFEGLRLKGQVLASGGDWVLRTPTGARLDVRLVLETDDGVTILFRYSGVAAPRDGGLRADVAGAFEAPAGPYAWLNDVHAVGFGSASGGVATYDFYQLL
jgi:hypothetical protein